jgi:phosphotriesterase-related protein
LATVESVTGPIEADDLGVTLIHEHFRTRDDANAVQFPHLYDEDALYAAGVEAARGALDRGVKTVVEPTAMFLSRDVRFMERIAKETGLQIVPWAGIQGTGTKAAFLKCAADEPGVNENIEKIHRACARASLRTGRPIMAHSRPASDTGPRQVEIFLEEGVAPEKIQIAHTGDTDDLGYIEGLLEKGVWIGLDRFGIEMYLPMENRLKTATALLERGYERQMFISADSCGSIDWFPEEQVEQLVQAGAVKDWTITLVHDQVIPALRERGMTDGQLDTLLVENPKRWLAG